MPRVQITARIPDGMVATLKEQADAEGRTFSQALERVLASVLTERGALLPGVASVTPRPSGLKASSQADPPPRSVSTEQFKPEFKPDFKGG